jgi:hypothetical protein
MTTVDLAAEFASRGGQPRVSRVDTAIFVRTYFTNCMECTFCGDACCDYGVDVDAENVARILAQADALESFTGVPRDRWFTGEWTEDREFPGGKNTRTSVVDGHCVFLGRRGRGCSLHAFALSTGADYHDLKPMVSALFPIAFDDGLLHPSDEVEDGSLVCLDRGPTLYRGARGELAYYFGPGLVANLDAIERSTLAPPSAPVSSSSPPTSSSAPDR